MSTHFYITVLLLTAPILLNVNAQTPIKEYVIRKDFFRFAKSSEFTVSDAKEKHVYYRMESNFNILLDVKLIAYPSKKEVGRLKSQINFIARKGKFSVLDSKSNKWVDGSILQSFKLWSETFIIEWNGHRITMEKKTASFTYIFFDSDGKEILAQIRLRPASILWTHKYDMKIFSNKYSEQIYLVALPLTLLK